VTPSAAVEARVNSEIQKADAIVAAPAPRNMFGSPYLVEAVYYHDGFLSDFPEDRPDADPARRVVAHIERTLTPEWKARYVALLDGLWEQDGRPGTAAIAPVPAAPPDSAARSKHWRRRTHEFAIDLFTAEGTPVRSVADGIVVLADRGWSGEDPFSTSSARGGNAVIVFEPATARFYRFCHLSQVAVEPGDFVSRGEAIGAVGHSGFNASLPRHGHHLHFEVNQYDGSTVRPYNHRQLAALLRVMPVGPLGPPVAGVIETPPLLGPSAFSPAAEPDARMLGTGR
jgi:murein DD-endopeptidase MepM/ murein hydrolase activator NlpD